MHSPPNRTAKDLLLHMADETNTIIETETHKSRTSARTFDLRILGLSGRGKAGGEAL